MTLGCFTKGRVIGYRFKCRRCGKLTAGRKPKRGDGSEIWPRKHNDADGKPCEGRFEAAEWVETPASWNAITGKFKLPRLRTTSQNIASSNSS